MKPVHLLRAAGLGARILALISLLAFISPWAVGQGVGEPGGTCSDSVPCYQGCCSKDYSCGFTPEHCGTGCISNCNATAECGQYALPGQSDCPVNVCCSEFGYCGVTSDFCGDGCQKNSNGVGCGQPDRPSCSANTDAMSFKRRIGYYELFNYYKGCNVIEPESLIIEPFTHINLAFVNFGDDYTLIDEYGDIVDRVSFLKFSNPGLRVNIAVGGWAFSDAPTQHLWTQMARSHENRQTFINSVVKYLQDYHLDGIDIDWEYPSASDRGGAPQDAANFNPGWEISATLPTSYWYLRGFDVDRMQKYVDYFNLMSYDLHGMWDQDSKWTGPYLQGHTDITQIELGLDLLWRNNIDPANVVFGIAFYGRSFTLTDSNCYQPNGECEFSDGGKPGSCSDTTGILTYAEISSRNNSLDVHTFYDPETTVKYNVYEGTQWISYDDEQSFFDKKKYVSERCLSGWMVWAIDQDTGEFDALAGLIGEDLSSLQMEGGLTGDAANVLADTFAAYTGQNCFVTPRCTDGSSKEKNADQVCPSGYLSVDTAHNPLQAGNRELNGDCAEGWYRHICCPKDAMPKNCRWNGAPERSEFGCDGKCGSNQFKLNQDTALDAMGEGQCFTGARYICCDSAAMFSDCMWTGCQGPLMPYTPAECPADYYYQTFRWDKPDGTPWCSDTYVSPVDGAVGSPLHDRFKSGLCCPTDQSFSNCAWTNSLQQSDMTGGDWADHIQDLVCKPRPCSAGKVKVAGALDPPPAPGAGSKSEINCDGVTVPPGTDPEWSYCCDPPTRYNKNWPVHPKYLWEKYYNDPKKSDVVWKYSDEYQNNDADADHSSEEDGSDAYGFVMLDGPEGSIDNDFATTQTVVRRSRDVPRVKRSVLTTNQTALDTVFDHSEETFHVYCNYPARSRECGRIFIDGAEDTIISLPDHIGEGPFARIVYMKPADEDFQLPDHHLEHRSVERIENPVYEVKIDYNFHLIKPKRDSEPVQMRVDYTNLLGYWDEMTDSPASRMRRSLGERGLTKEEWRARVQRAVVRDKTVRKRDEKTIQVRTPMAFSGSHIDKRWWGAFKDWLRKLTTVTKSSIGVIPLGFSHTINLFRAQWGCPGQTYSANLRMDLEADLAMDATYAYYLSATFIPPGKPETFAYFGMEPTAYLGLHIEGNAQMQTTTGRKKIIDTLSYPGLAVKGIAAVGPTLDIYGEAVDAGATLTFGKAEVYWPQNDDAKDQYETLLGLESDTAAPAPGSIEPRFEAGVAVDAQLDILVTPEANIGIKIGGGKLVGGATLMDAQLTGYVMGDLSFQAHGDYDTASNSFQYRFGAYLFYNLGYKATAQILNFIDWALGPRQAYTPNKTVKLYEKQGSIPMGSSSDQQARDLTVYGPVERRHIAAELPADANMSAYLDPATGLFRRSDPMDLDDPNDPEFTQNLQCPPGSSGDVKLPELRFNCDLLWGFVEPASGKTSDETDHDAGKVTGLCEPILDIPSNKRTEAFTFSNDKDRTAARYKAQCPSGTCKQPSADLNKALNRRNLQLQCDEFPWKSSEQGGHYLPSDSRSATCVPSFQNNWHGQCLKLMGQFQSNWKKLDPDAPADDEREDYWVPWSSPRWTSIGEYGPEGSKYSQKLIEYPTAQPPPDGVRTRNDDKLSWAFKRDYRVSWIHQDPTTITSSTWWDATGKTLKGGGHGPAGMDAILCAVNIFGQEDTYKLPQGQNGPYNAYCRKESNEIKYWSVDYSMGTCLVTFADGTSNTKRDSGSWAGWEVKSVEMVDNVAGDLEEDLRRAQEMARRDRRP
ncbi:hypothetical protein AN0517.2 [Aspergillus nidulans FGSC A4]|uniref:chitinase n=1 Tax=Emericella nidulans (strain FGSC A4 / ATCC 38163 / CBS 112.46 / NRRL 194 / M139) TaxID=227321 RepID=Q5BG13_EMENI|nr:hypothetical protein [Aspergillus nidulans FGSC A4]EAA66616.1 hypothetical protein AN0517.2 [Aspergillus nidulans FGSC A4]CBF89323.1 TPA: conserved hypothetical protein [Aspergillus nidulans FGSC A4]|eukprot:XP_658121.1 hypothetical protein AN0517.2 [Aspergillus nidulans FGSC A4]